MLDRLCLALTLPFLMTCLPRRSRLEQMIFRILRESSNPRNEHRFQTIHINTNNEHKICKLLSKSKENLYILFYFNCCRYSYIFGPLITTRPVSTRLLIIYIWSLCIFGHFETNNGMHCQSCLNPPCCSSL